MELTSYLKFDAKAINADNLCDRFSDEDLDKIGTAVKDGYERDLASRDKWEKRTQAAMDLAMQVQKNKNFPWPNCANVAFPLITIAALQFHARAYPAIIQGPDVVRYRVITEDPTGVEADRAKRIGTHMSWQLTEQDAAWEEQLDRALLICPIVGCVFKKSYYSSSKGHNVSELVMAQDFVIDYYARSVEDARRKTHVIPIYKNEIHERCLRGVYRDVLEESWYQSPPPGAVTTSNTDRDKRVGSTPPMPDNTTPFRFLEQYCWFDLDGDGYEEPYTITIEENSGCVVRIAARVDGERFVERTRDGRIISITCSEYFTKIPFIPSPDGGIYDVGFGVLLGPLNESTNTLLNQLIDAGTMATTGGGFLGRGAKIRGGVYTFAPLEWKRVDSTGDDLRKNIVPLEVREPSAVLFQLLSLLINYAQRVSGATDMLVGENPGQNTPAETSRSMVEQGGKIYSAIFKRIWRAMQLEFKKLYILNGQFLPVKQTFGVNGAFALRSDYLSDPSLIAPVADPNVLSDQQKLMQAQAIMQAGRGNPAYDQDEVERTFLKAIKVDNIDKLYLGVKNVPPPGPTEKVQIEMLKSEQKNLALQAQMQMFAAQLMEDQRINSAKIMELQAKAAKAIADANSEQQYAEVAAMQAAINMEKLNYEKVTRMLELLLKGVEIDGKLKDADGSGISGVVSQSSNPAIQGLVA